MDGSAGVLYDEYGYERTRDDMTGELVTSGERAILRQRAWWKAHFVGLENREISEMCTQKWRRKNMTATSTSRLLQSPSSSTSAWPSLAIPPPLRTPLRGVRPLQAPWQARNLFAVQHLPGKVD